MNSQDRPTMARTFVYLYGIGGTLVLATLALPHGDDRWLPGLIGVAVAALLVATVCIVGFDRLPERFFELLPPIGTLLVSLAVYSGGSDLTSTYATFYFWVALAAFSFFSVRSGLVNLVLIGIGFGLVLEVQPGASVIEARWLTVLGTVTVLAFTIAVLRERAEHLVESLRRRSDKQEAVAELGRRALSGATPPELARLAAERVARGLDVAHAAVLSHSIDDESLTLTASNGFEPELLPWATITREDPLIKRALASANPVVAEAYGEELAACGYEGPLGEMTSGIAVAIPGPEHPVGVISAYSREPYGFSSSHAAFLEAVAHVLADAIERRRSDEEARHRAMHDRLTGRPNRALFTERLDRSVTEARDRGKLLAVYFLDIDEFKLINDTLGHTAGDELLRIFGARLREALVMTDTVARFGGDEFAILCEDVHGERHVLEIAEQLLVALAQPFHVGETSHRISASIGIAMNNAAGDAEELIAQADAAMYRAKECSRGSYQLFDSNLREQVRQRLHFGAALRSATEGERLKLIVQPIVELPSGEEVGSEALLRWRHPDLGPVSPVEFIPVAEETGAILRIGHWVIEEAFALAAQWRSEPAARGLLPMHVNISARQLAQADFADTVAAEVSTAGVRMRDLRFEITEHALLGDAQETVRTLERLQEMGIGIVLDDFGTGYSSLSHLKRFPLDMVKVDRLFVSSLATSPKDEAIVSAVLGMADAFALDVVAEGIETWQQATHLAGLGCGYGQGFLFARPTAPEELLASRLLESGAGTAEDHADASRGDGNGGQPLSRSPTARSASDLVG